MKRWNKNNTKKGRVKGNAHLQRRRIENTHNSSQKKKKDAFRLYLLSWWGRSVNTGAALGRPASASRSVPPSHTLTHTHTNTHSVCVFASSFSLGGLRALACARIHVPTFCAHSIGRLPSGVARHWPSLPASDRSAGRWLDSDRGTQGPAHSCVARVHGVGGEGAAPLQQAGVNWRIFSQKSRSEPISSAVFLLKNRLNKWPRV